MKKFIPICKITAIILLVVCMLLVPLTLIGCNKQLFDATYDFDYAYISFGDGAVKKIEIASWRDFEDGDQIQITSKDGTTYLAHSLNCILVKEGK